MAHRLTVSEPSDYTGTLTLGRHPDGELAFEDGVATVESEQLADTLSDHYPNITHERPSDASEDSDDDTADEEAVPETIDEENGADGDDATDPPLDPDDHTVSDLEDELDDGDFSADELGAIREAEKAGKNRETALEAIDTALED